MDTINANLIDTLLPQTSPDGIKRSGDASQAQKIQFAKDFESVFIEKLLDEMKNTIGNWGLEQDAAAKQVQGLFWLHLAQDVSAKGGMGMWKEIYQSLNQAEHETGNAESLDKKL